MRVKFSRTQLICENFLLAITLYGIRTWLHITTSLTITCYMAIVHYIINISTAHPLNITLHDHILPRMSFALMTHHSCSHYFVNGVTFHGLYGHVGLMSAPDVELQEHYVSPWEQATVEHCSVSVPHHLVGCHPA